MKPIDPQIFEDNHDFMGTKGLIFIGDKILTYLRDGRGDFLPNGIDLPGGGREDKETPFQTFQREVSEEFSLDIKQADLKWARAFQSTIDPNRIGYFFVAKLPEDRKMDIKFGDEGVEYYLMDLNEYLARDDIHPVHRARALEYISSAKE